MMEWVKTWIQGIIFAVIVSTIIEMIIPENKTQKYIKTVIGIYIVYMIIGPIISRFAGKKLDINLSKYLQTENKATYSTIDINNSIKENYLENLKKDVTEKLSAKGYAAENIEIIISEKEENYGEILKMKLKLEEKSVNHIKIKKVNISGNEAINKENPVENTEIKKYLQEIYYTENIEIL